MTKALFFLIPLACAVAMGFWLKHARQVGGHRWITHWFATLAPLGLLAGLHSLGLVTQTLANVLMVPMVLGLAAFAGGALYLAGPTLLAGLKWMALALRERLKDLSESISIESTSEKVYLHRISTSLGKMSNVVDDHDDDSRFISEAHRRDVEIHGEHRYHRYGDDND